MFEKEKLDELEKDNHIRILYACESGSRAWGFPSPDSDFDVRFIYARTKNDYLGIHETKDVIDLPVNDVLDIGGWDIKKALKLFLKSNGPLYEWLQSPIIYKDDSGFTDELRKLMPRYFSSRACGNHYLSMALNTVNNDLQTD
ncbi:MAG TPA: nucleotidyltransferase domain-containing protein, partial [Mucilaginibacter sp.]